MTSEKKSVQTRYSFYESEEPLDFSSSVSKDVKEKPLEIVQSVDVDDDAMQSAVDSIESPDTQPSSFTSDFQEDAEKDTGIEEQVSNGDVNNSTNPYEKAIREALIYIRKRSHERCVAMSNINPEASNTGLPWKLNSTGEPLEAAISSLPLSPGNCSTAVMTATKLDNRLLSPPADVRQAAAEILREKNDEDDINEKSIEVVEAIGLAKPLASQSNSMLNRNDSSNSYLPPNFTIMPTSPAPEKLHPPRSLHQHMVDGEDFVGAEDASDVRRRALEMERSFRREVALEKGVEQVLMAILEGVSSNNSNSQLQSDDVNSKSVPSTMENVLSSLFQNQVAINGSNHSKSLNFDVEDDEFANPKPIGASTVQEISDDKLIFQVADAQNVPEVFSDKDDYDGEDESDEDQDGDDDDEGEDDENEYDDGEGSGPCLDQDEMVLGRLSGHMGGKTGVVLESDEQSDSSAIKIDDEDRPSSPEQAGSPSIMSSMKSVVKRSSDFMKSSSSRSVDGNEAIVRDLYSHILVRHPSQKVSKAITSRQGFAQWMSDKFNRGQGGDKFVWDEKDPEEPGYITHLYTRGKLQEIESTFEQMIERADSEYALISKDVKKEQKALSSDFERDLLEAEEMLENEKKSNPPVKSKEEDEKSDPEIVETAQSVLATNPNFPGAKAAGTGDVGDLEIYHLPIIYKAHQTGFEPTKDLVLNSDTVFAGQYYVQQELGSAAFSTAYRCVDLNSGKKAEDGEVYYDEVCLKVIKNTKDFFDQSLDEIKILELLRQTEQCSEHNILEMKAFFYHKEHLIIVTELLRQNLFEFGKYIMEHDEPQYFTIQRLCYIARQCLVALSFVHKMGLVHSDIKPENILLTSYSRARVKVIDFGSSCYLTDRQSSYIQSRSYRAPEVVLGLPYDGKIDVWSLGCVIAEMFTGQVTFQNDSVVSMLARIEAICGAFPRHVIEEGRQSGQFFTPTGLLYEKVESDDNSAIRMNTSTSFTDDDSVSGENSLFNILQPKTTTMAERLGFDPNLMNTKRKTWEEDEKALFTDFVTKLLTIDPDKRPSAEEALEHPWILSGFNLTEEDLKYPPEEP